VGLAIKFESWDPGPERSVDADLQEKQIRKILGINRLRF
jgi:hypothetical protein